MLRVCSSAGRTLNRVRGSLGFRGALEDAVCKRTLESSQKVSLYRQFSKKVHADTDDENQLLQKLDREEIKPYSPEEIIKAQGAKTDKEFELAAEAWKTGDMKDLGNLMKEVNAPLVIPVEDSDKRLMNDPRAEENSYISLDTRDTGLLGGMIRSDSDNTQMRVKDNPLVAEVLSNKAINISDPRVKVGSLDLQDLALIQDAGELAQLKLGNIEVLKKDAVSLKDIDVSEIPEHLDVIVTPREKEVILLGKKMDSTAMTDDEQTNRSDNTKKSEVSAFTQKVQPQVFNEKSHQEFQDEHSFFFDPKFRVTSTTDYIARFLRTVPFGVFLLCYLTTWLEDRQVDRNPRLLEEQEQAELETFRRKQIMRLNLEQNRTSLASFLGELESNKSPY